MRLRALIRTSSALGRVALVNGRLLDGRSGSEGGESGGSDEELHGCELFERVTSSE